MTATWILFVIFCIGAYFLVEAAANISYWWNDKHPWYFQLGRALRLIFGLILMVIAVQ